MDTSAADDLDVVGIPVPGQAVRGSQTGAPIMALFDLLGRRWAMGVLWTTCEIGPTTFRKLQKRCGTVSTAVLNQRLKELQAAKLLVRTEHGYEPTEMGRRVYDGLVPLGETARAWGRVLARPDPAPVASVPGLGEA